MHPAKRQDLPRGIVSLIAGSMTYAIRTLAPVIGDGPVHIDDQNLR
jgi:hypothetical protein